MARTKKQSTEAAVREICLTGTNADIRGPKKRKAKSVGPSHLAVALENCSNGWSVTLAQSAEFPTRTDHSSPTPTPTTDVYRFPAAGTLTLVGNGPNSIVSVTAGSIAFTGYAVTLNEKVIRRNSARMRFKSLSTRYEIVLLYS